MNRITEMKMVHDGGTSEYTVTSTKGCVYKNLMKGDAKKALELIVNDSNIEELQAEIKELKRRNDLYKKSNDFYGAKEWFMELDIISGDRWGSIIPVLKKEKCGRILKDGGKLARQIEKEVSDER